ncbi:MAG: glycosyltransferase [Cystobacterineae bacterium]|nr:glycosyltransferase [Cystobacterineae bacterium]
MKVAFIHDWLVSYRGGEKVLNALFELFPQAKLYTLFYERGSVPGPVERAQVYSSFLDRPWARKRHRMFLPLFPLAISRFSLKGYELVISSSHCAAKAAPVPQGVPHLCYIHAPLRYMWTRFDDYFGKGRASLPLRIAAKTLRPFLQRWDKKSARRVTHFVANSHYIAKQVELLYGQKASVVYPPVELERFLPLPVENSGQGGYFLCFGALAPYKRLDLAIEAFGRLGLPLWVAGSGQMEAAFRKNLPGNIRWLGQVPEDEVPALLHAAKALVFPGEEDFGLTPIEVQACGRPVIALGRGGALETITPKTGLFFAEPTAASLERAVLAFAELEKRFLPTEAKENAMRFSKENFLQGMRAQVQTCLGDAP